MPTVFSKEIPQEAIDAFDRVYADNKVSWILSGSLASVGISYYIYQSMFTKDVTKQQIKQLKSQKKEKKIKTAVDAKFVANLRRLLRIAIPALWSREVGYLFILAFFLVVRTVLSIRIADVNGKIVKSIVNRKFWTVEFLFGCNLSLD